MSTVFFIKCPEEKSVEKEERKESGDLKCAEETDLSQKENVPLSQSKCLKFDMNSDILDQRRIQRGRTRPSPTDQVLFNFIGFSRRFEKNVWG